MERSGFYKSASASDERLKPICQFLQCVDSWFVKPHYDSERGDFIVFLREALRKNKLGISSITEEREPPKPKSSPQREFLLHRVIEPWALEWRRRLWGNEAPLPGLREVSEYIHQYKDNRGRKGITFLFNRRENYYSVLDSPLLELKREAADLAEGTNFYAPSLIGLVLVGERPLYYNIRIRKKTSGSLAQTPFALFKKTFTVELSSTVSKKKWNDLFHQVKEYFSKGPRKYQSRDVDLYRFIAERELPPKGEGREAFWKRAVPEWNKEFGKLHGRLKWDSLKKAWERLEKALRKEFSSTDQHLRFPEGEFDETVTENPDKRLIKVSRASRISYKVERKANP